MCTRILPPDSNGPSSGKENSGDGVDNGAGNGIDNGSDGVGNGAGGGLDNAINNGGFNVSGNGINNGSSFNASSNETNNGSGFSEEDLSNSFAGARIGNSNNAQSQNHSDLRHIASNFNIANSYPDLERIVNFIDTQNQTCFNNSLGQHASNNGSTFNLGHQGLLNVAGPNSSQQPISFSKPVPYYIEPAVGPKTVDAAYNAPTVQGNRQNLFNAARLLAMLIIEFANLEYLVREFDDAWYEEAARRTRAWVGEMLDDIQNALAPLVLSGRAPPNMAAINAAIAALRGRLGDIKALPRK